jgi:hypothetical protein
MSQTPVVGETFTFGVGLFQQADTKLLQANPTIAAGDFQRSINGGAFANLDNLPTVTPAGGYRVEVVISAAETTSAAAGGEIWVRWVDQAGAEWCDGFAIIRPATYGIDDATLANPIPFLIGQKLTVDTADTVAFFLVDDVGDAVAGLGNTFTVQISKDGGAFAGSAGTKAEIAGGWYTYEFTAGELDTVGPLAIQVTHAAIRALRIEYTVVSATTAAIEKGDIEYTYTLTNDATGLPIPDADIWVSTNLAGTNIIWRGTTDAFGVARDITNQKPWLNAGTYYFWRGKVSFTFDPKYDIEVVSDP